MSTWVDLKSYINNHVMPVPTAAGQVLTSTAAGAGNFEWDSISSNLICSDYVSNAIKTIQTKDNNTLICFYGATTLYANGNVLCAVISGVPGYSARMGIATLNDNLGNAFWGLGANIKFTISSSESTIWIHNTQTNFNSGTAVYCSAIILYTKN